TETGNPLCPAVPATNSQPTLQTSAGQSPAMSMLTMAVAIARCSFAIGSNRSVNCGGALNLRTVFRSRRWIQIQGTNTVIANSPMPILDRRLATPTSNVCHQDAGMAKDQAASAERRASVTEIGNVLRIQSTFSSM